jgi:hypothetical protein
VSVTTVAVSVVTTVVVSEVVVVEEELSPQATKVPKMATKRSFFIVCLIFVFGYNTLAKKR